MMRTALCLAIGVIAVTAAQAQAQAPPVMESDYPLDERQQQRESGFDEFGAVALEPAADVGEVQA